MKITDLFLILKISGRPGMDCPNLGSQVPSTWPSAPGHEATWLNTELGIMEYMAGDNTGDVFTALTIVFK